jgi:hypothetical protein
LLISSFFWSDESTVQELKCLLIELLNRRIKSQEEHIQWATIKSEALHVFINSIDVLYPSPQQKAALLFNLISQKIESPTTTTSPLMRTEFAKMEPEIKEQIIESLLDFFCTHQVIATFFSSDRDKKEKRDI